MATEKAAESHSKPGLRLQMTVFEHGGATSISAESAAFDPVRRAAEDMFASSNDVLFELVEPDTIRQTKATATALELVYKTPLVIKVCNPTLKEQAVTLDRLLIPLSGYYAPGTVFYGLRTYQSGPVLNVSGNEPLRELLLEHGLLHTKP